MKLSRDAELILEVLADEREKNPHTRLEGINDHVLGKRIGAHLGNVMYPVAELADEGLVSKHARKVIITEKGYKYKRPWYRRLVKEHHLLIIVSIIITLVAIIVGVAQLMR